MNIAHEGVYDFGTGTWEVDTDDRTEYVFPLEVTVPGLEEGGSPTIDDNGNEVYPSYDTPIMSGSSTLMMVPQDLAGSALMLEYTPDGEGEEMMELAVELSGSWEAGAHITYHISFLAADDDILPYLTGTDGFFHDYVRDNFDTDNNGHVSQAEAETYNDRPHVGTRSLTFNADTAPVFYVPDNSVDNYSSRNGSSTWYSYFSSFKGLSDLATDFPDKYDENGKRLTTTEP